MSYVTNAMVILGYENDDKLLQGIEFRSGQRFKCITSAGGSGGNNWGGTKWPEIEVYAAAFNYVNVDEIMRAIAAVKWERPQDIRLIIQDEDCMTAGFWILMEGAWKQVAPMSRW